MTPHEHRTKIRKAYLEQLHLWRPLISPSEFNELRLERKVRRIVEELLHSPQWEAKRGDDYVVLTETNCLAGL